MSEIGADAVKILHTGRKFREEMGFKYKAIYEKPDEPHRFNEVERFSRVAWAYQRIRNSRIGLVGYADMGLYTCSYDRSSLASQLGIDVEDYFSCEIGKLMDEAPVDEINNIIGNMRRYTSDIG